MSIDDSGIVEERLRLLEEKIKDLEEEVKDLQWDMTGVELAVEEIRMGEIK